MPLLDKKTLSRFFASGCEKQLRLFLSPPKGTFQAERDSQGMPPEQPPRPGLEQVAQAGEAWTDEKVSDLAACFGTAALIGTSKPIPGTTRVRFTASPLADLLHLATANCFLVEAEFPVGATFQRAVDVETLAARVGLGFAKLRPDLIEIRPPRTMKTRVLATGEVIPLPEDDHRTQLRVIDIKLTAEPGPHYFAEVAYYSMALAGWLVDEGLDEEYVVTPDAALWPGSHDASELVKVQKAAADEGRAPTVAELLAGLSDDLELAPLEVFVSRLRHFFAEELPRVLDTPWRDLPWHVSTDCRGCEYLGQTWPGAAGAKSVHPDHCIPTAVAEGHLSRIAYVSRGASSILQSSGVKDVGSVAGLTPTDTVFDRHHSLRAQRVVIAGRAQSLQLHTTAIPPNAGTSAIMPKWADLRIFITADYDVTSAITLAFGIQGFWAEPTPFGSASSGKIEAFPPSVFVVGTRSIQDEERELMAFLDRLETILATVDKNATQSSVQIYVWDDLVFEHLTRVIGRHLPLILADGNLQRLAWLFPPEDLVGDPSAVRSPVVTIVGNVVRTLLAVPVAHHYSLLSTAREYHDPSIPANLATFVVPSLFEDPLSDQVPSERAHAIWTRTAGKYDWSAQLEDLRRTVRTKLRALESVTKQLRSDLASLLNRKAPQLSAIRKPDALAGIAVDGKLWYAHARMNEALAATEIAQMRAMPAHEREARFVSCRCPRRLMGQDEQNALTALGLPAASGRRVYEIAPGSTEVKIDRGAFLCALIPENDTAFLDRPLAAIIQGHADLELRWQKERWRPFEKAVQVTVVEIDRDRRLLVVDLNRADQVDELESRGLLDLSVNVSCEPIAGDFFPRRLKETLQAIKSPPSATNDPLIARAFGKPKFRPHVTAAVPAEDFLWKAAQTAAETTGRSLVGLRMRLEAAGVALNDSQWLAWEYALTHRLSLIWGPPGTGKSTTLEAVVLGACVSAADSGLPFRVLISANTYNAIDTLLQPVARRILQVVPGAEVYRLRSSSSLASSVTGAHDVPLSYPTSADALALRDRLFPPGGITVVASPPMQIEKLLEQTTGSPMASAFDLIVLDEASQLDVAHAVLPLAGAAPGASLVVAGDPLQLPPIHQAEPPLNFESLVGPVYTFFERHWGIVPRRLEVNYRSNQEIVDLAHVAGYSATLTSATPSLRIALLSKLPTSPAAPPGWPSILHWTPEWATLLDPERPVVGFIYPDGFSGQWNEFEADAVAALAYLLYGRLGSSMSGDVDPSTGAPLPAPTAPYPIQEFWKVGVGVATPHKAQQARIVNRLAMAFGGTGATRDLLRSAVDTVDRFQGQQRDVILASFAVGDPDTVASEADFLQSLNRFNVLASRARAKLIVFMAEELVQHLAGDIEVLRDSKLLKAFAETFCRNRQALTLGVTAGPRPGPVQGSLRWR